jgi:integrase
VTKYAAERAISPLDRSVSWVIVDEALQLHPKSCAFLAQLRARDLSSNTERVYAGRTALYLSHCSGHGVDWSSPGVPGLARFLRWLVEEPLPPRGLRALAEPRFRSRKTANAVMTTVCEFLRFGAGHGWVPGELVAQLSEPKFLAFTPPGFQAGEDGQYRMVRAKVLKYQVADDGYDWLTADQAVALIPLARLARDRFLIALLGQTGLRIGEALGLRREDMHLLSDSQSLGCKVPGPHVHVRRRINANGALAKSRNPRSVPVTWELVDLYAEYVYERDAVVEAAECDMVFVNVARPPLGRAMSYPNAKDMFDRLARRAGFEVWPHLLRHTAATGMLRAGTPRDVVQQILGHASPISMDPYLHASDQDKRRAVERVAHAREGV